MDKEFEQELRHELNKLNERVSAQRLGGTARETIEQTTNLFEEKWLERLVIEERAELRGARVGIDTAIRHGAEQQRILANIRDNARMPSMTPEGQVAYTEGSRNGLVPGVNDEQERGRQTREVTLDAEAAIKADYVAVRKNFINSLQEIESGRNPNFSMLPAQQLINAPSQSSDPVSRARPNPGENWDQYVARRVQERREEVQQNPALNYNQDLSRKPENEQDLDFNR